jgi:hypothetical protein
VRVIKLAAGLAIGYVLGSRAGREKYEQIVTTARKVQDHPAVAQAQEKAKGLLTSGTDTGTDTGSSTDASSADDTDVVVTDVQEAVVVNVPTPKPPRRRPQSAPTTPVTPVTPS